MNDVMKHVVDDDDDEDDDDDVGRALHVFCFWQNKLLLLICSSIHDSLTTNTMS